MNSRPYLISMILVVLLALLPFTSAPAIAQEVEIADTFWPDPVVTQEGRDIKVEWEDKPNATHYEIFYWVHGMQDWVYLSSVDAPTTEKTITPNAVFQPQDGRRYYFFLKSFTGPKENLTYQASTWYSSLYYQSPDEWIRLSSATINPEAWAKYKSLYPNKDQQPQIFSVSWNNYSGNIRVTFQFPGEHTRDGKTGTVYANQIYRGGVLMGTVIFLISHDESVIVIQAYEDNK